MSSSTTKTKHTTSSVSRISKSRPSKHTSSESFSMSRYLNSDGESIHALMQDPQRRTSGNTTATSTRYMPTIVGGSNPTSIKDDAFTSEQSRCVLGVGAGLYR